MNKFQKFSLIFSIVSVIFWGMTSLLDKGDETNSSVSHSTTEKSSAEKKTSIDLTKFKDFQFFAANIKPIKATIKGDEMRLDFDWRNDDASGENWSFLGSGVTLIISQNNKEITKNDSNYSGEAQKIATRTSLDIQYDYTLLDKSPVTVKLVPLEGETKEFTFDIK